MKLWKWGVATLVLGALAGGLWWKQALWIPYAKWAFFGQAVNASAEVLSSPTSLPGAFTERFQQQEGEIKELRDNQQKLLQNNQALADQVKQAVTELAKAERALQVVGENTRANAPASSIAAQDAVSSPTSSPTITKSTLININAASVSELDVLPGIGPVIAGRIVDYRDKNGPFKQLSDLKKVSGIGDAVFKKVQSLISLDD